MSFKSRFLKNRNPGVVNTVFLKEVGTKNSFIFHPFIEAFDHVVEPNIVEEKYGLFGAVSNHRAGFGIERYTMTLVLPAVDGPSARTNYRKIERLLRAVNPTRQDLLSSDALFTLRVKPLIPRTLKGHITSVSEQHDIETGFIDGYPKVMRVTFTFTVDKLLEQLGRAKEAPRPAQEAGGDEETVKAVNTLANPADPKSRPLGNIASVRGVNQSVDETFAKSTRQSLRRTSIDQGQKKASAKPLPGATKKR